MRLTGGHVRHAGSVSLGEDKRVSTDEAGPAGILPYCELAPLTSAAIFLVARVTPSSGCVDEMMGCGDGAEKSVDEAALESAIIGDEVPGCAGGRYVIVKKYGPDMADCKALTTEEKEKNFGGTKLADIVLDDATKPSSA